MIKYGDNGADFYYGDNQAVVIYGEDVVYPATASSIVLSSTYKINKDAKTDLSLIVGAPGAWTLSYSGDYLSNFSTTTGTTGYTVINFDSPVNNTGSDQTCTITVTLDSDSSATATCTVTKLSYNRDEVWYYNSSRYTSYPSFTNLRELNKAGYSIIEQGFAGNRGYYKFNKNIDEIVPYMFQNFRVPFRIFTEGINTKAANYAFQSTIVDGSVLQDVPEEYKTLTLDLRNCTGSLQCMFNDATYLKSLTVNHLENVGSVEYAFDNMQNLEYIEINDLYRGRTIGQMNNFIGSSYRSKCTEVRFNYLPLPNNDHNAYGFYYYWSMSNMGRNNGYLSRDSLLNILDKLPDITSYGYTKYCSLGNNNLNKLTAEEKAIATNKGWTLM